MLEKNVQVLFSVAIWYDDGDLMLRQTSGWPEEAVLFDVVVLRFAVIEEIWIQIIQAQVDSHSAHFWVSVEEATISGEDVFDGVRRRSFQIV